jgi:hypothetical protein
MIEQKLFAANGDFVVTALIAPLDPKPDLIIWGSRFFLWCEPCQKYKEGFAVVTFHTKPNIK